MGYPQESKLTLIGDAAKQNCCIKQKTKNPQDFKVIKKEEIRFSLFEEIKNNI